MTFNRLEMEAVVKLAMQIAAADGKFAEEEKIMIALNAASFGISPDLFESIFHDAMTMKSELALAAIAAMDSDQKRYVTAYLGTIIAADGDIDDSEMKIWSLVSALCDLPTMSIAEAMKIMKEEI